MTRPQLKRATGENGFMSKVRNRRTRGARRGNKLLLHGSIRPRSFSLFSWHNFITSRRKGSSV